MTVMNALVQAAPYIHLLMKEDINLGIVDKSSNAFLCYMPSKEIDFQIKAGDPINPDDHNVQTALRGQVSHTYVSEDVYGVPFGAAAFPVYDDQGQIVGAIAVGYPMDKEQKLDQYMERIERIVTDLQEKIHTVASHSEELAAASDEVAAQSKNALENSEKTQDITNFIRSVSRQTNLLGLNASIEAARAGQYGAGFNVVAQEVRKLSNETSNATESIEQALSIISTNIGSLMENTSHIHQASKQQADLVQDFSYIMDSLSTVSEEMKQFMKQVMRS
ncbi:chemotaxis protein [Domibacillus antri]|uniref:Chemotaxis protein n=2 Tax=Domibacillus antri TaxID=1714264 RepID=A0A1Q8Q3P8_9BACI|nr:methyl-accepting chemotaxis protein [Domibacillus antri]OLN21983.1 chemotaxis protein [Domibacillus antri]